MKGYVFDPSRLARSPKQQERDRYAAAGRMLRESLGGEDIFAEVRERVRRDPQLRAMISLAGKLIEATDESPRLSAARRRRLLRAVDEIERKVHLPD